jgi:hypothetical protein
MPGGGHRAGVGRDEEPLALHARGCDRRADGGFVFVHGGRMAEPNGMALCTTGCDSPPGIRNVPKPRRGMSTPWVLITFMKVFLSYILYRPPR